MRHRHDTRRILASLLIAAYLPLLVASVLHVHRPTAATCHDCAAHVAHPAHIGSRQTSTDDCFLCLVIGSLYCPASPTDEATIAEAEVCTCSAQATSPTVAAASAVDSRAPPRD